MNTGNSRRIIALDFRLNYFQRAACIFVSGILLSACSSTHHLPQTPNIYSTLWPYPAEVVAESEQTTEVNIIFVTDRNKIVENGVLIEYGDERSESMAFGNARVRYGEEITWDELVDISQSHEKKTKVDIRLISLSEVDRFPPTPLAFSVGETGIVVDPVDEKNYTKSTENLKKLIRERISSSHKKDVIVYVHGFNNSFDDAIFALNDIWHFTGRSGVPIVYSWPSRNGNLLGYFSDRESGEFTIYHLKEFFRILSTIDEVENVHVISHSRGTDITTSALRELIIEARAGGFDPRRKLKLENLIMAAPDLDYGVVTQRLIAERFGPAFGKITIYMNTSDAALGLSQKLMRGLRFGRLSADQQSSREDKIFRSIKNVTFINVEDVSGFVGHGYFRKHPGVLSDIVQLIRFSDTPGSSGRPLMHVKTNFWSLNKDYMKRN